MRIREFDIDAPRQGLAGTQGLQVRVLQKALQSLGYSVGSTGVDGIYGPRTARAVAQFQRDAGIKVDGDAGPETVAAMKQQIQTNKVDIDKPFNYNDEEKARAVLDMIADVESSGKYDAVYPGKKKPAILDMTIRELLDDMKQRAKEHGSSASGRYQYITKTLKELVKDMNLDIDTKFTPQTQDKIALYHLKQYHGLERWMAGRMSSAQFLNNLSKTWAGLPNPSTGASYYAGVLDNRAGVNAKTATSMLDKIQGTV